MFTITIEWKTSPTPTVHKMKLWETVTGFLKHVENDKNLLNWTVKSEDFKDN